MNAKWSFEVAREALPLLLPGLLLTLQVVLLGSVLAFSLGLLLALIARSGRAPLARPTRALVLFVRNTPLLVQVYFLHYFVLPELFGASSALLTGTVAIGLHYAAYTSEVYRAALDHVPRTQWDASSSLGLSRAQTYRLVIVPQAIPPMLAPLGNYVIAMFKDVPILSAISVAEVLTRALEYGARNFRYVEVLTLVGVLYLVVSVAASAWLGRLEERMRARGAHG